MLLCLILVPISSNSNPIECTPLPVEATLAYGLKEDYSVDALFDGNMATQSVFRGATMHVTTTTPM